MNEILINIDVDQEPLDEVSSPFIQVPPEVKKLACNRETGETILHRAARLDYQVKMKIYTK